MTYIPGKDLKSGNSTSYEDWEAGVERIFKEQTGQALEDFDERNLLEWYDSGVSARETVYWILKDLGYDVDAEDVYEWLGRPLTGREKILGVA